jgi:hypothetical protein
MTLSETVIFDRPSWCGRTTRIGTRFGIASRGNHPRYWQSSANAFSLPSALHDSTLHGATSGLLRQPASYMVAVEALGTCISWRFACCWTCHSFMVTETARVVWLHEYEVGFLTRMRGGAGRGGQQAG